MGYVRIFTRLFIYIWSAEKSSFFFVLSGCGQKCKKKKKNEKKKSVTITCKKQVLVFFRKKTRLSCFTFYSLGTLHLKWTIFVIIFIINLLFTYLYIYLFIHWWEEIDFLVFSLLILRKKNPKNWIFKSTYIFIFYFNLKKNLFRF